MKKVKQLVYGKDPIIAKFVVNGTIDQKMYLKVSKAL